MALRRGFPAIGTDLRTGVEADERPLARLRWGLIAVWVALGIACMSFWVIVAIMAMRLP